MPTTSTYVITIQKLRATKARIERNYVQLEADSLAYDNLLGQLQSQLGDKIGQNVQLVPEGLRAVKSLEQIVLRRIKSLRTKFGFDEIAVKLNIEGFKCDGGDKFTGASVRALWDKSLLEA